VKELALLGLKALAGGALVVSFAALSDVLKPKALAGLFAAAPSVALASLGIASLAVGTARASQAAGAMVAGAVGMVAFCIVAMLLERRTGAVAGSALAWLAWLGAAGASSWVLMR